MKPVPNSYESYHLHHLPVLFGSVQSTDIAVHHDEPVLPEGSRANVASLVGDGLPREHEEHEARLHRIDRLGLEPQHGRTLLVAETKRTPLLG